MTGLDWQARGETGVEPRDSEVALVATFVGGERINRHADVQMGRVLDALEKNPHRDNTIVILISDHGFHLNEKQHWQKSSFWEEATHCLLMARVPGVTRAGGKSTCCVSLQDLYPALTELCDLKAAPKLAVRPSSRAAFENPKAPWASTGLTAFDDQYLSLRT